MIRILLADHHPASLWALKTMIAEDPDFELVGEATDMDRLLELSKGNHPHLIVIDRGLPGGQIEDLIHELHLLEPRPVVFAVSSDDEQACAMLRAGADAFVSKGEQVDWLIQVLRKRKNSILKAQTNLPNDKE